MEGIICRVQESICQAVLQVGTLAVIPHSIASNFSDYSVIKSICLNPIVVRSDSVSTILAYIEAISVKSSTIAIWSHVYVMIHNGIGFCWICLIPQTAHSLDPWSQYYN